MVELTSGCILLSIDDYRFDLAIQEIIATARPHLIINRVDRRRRSGALAYRVKKRGSASMR